MVTWYEILGIVILVMVILLLLKKLFKGSGGAILESIGEVLSNISAEFILYILFFGAVIFLLLYLSSAASSGSQSAQILLHLFSSL